MKSFRSKASRFFREGASSEEKVAINNTSSFDFDAGIDSTVTRKVVWPFRRKNDKAAKPQPALRLNSSSSTLMPPARPCVIGHEASDDFDLLPDYDDSDDDDTQAFRRSPATSNKKKKYRNAFSSRIFNSNKKSYSRSPPPPPVPQIPVDFTIPLPTRYSALPPSPPPLPKRSSNRPPRPTLKKAKRGTGPMSRPTPTSQDANIPLVLEHLTTTPFTPRSSPPPQRPPRPNESQNDTLMYIRYTNARMVLPIRPRPDTSTPPDPSQSTTIPSASPSSSTLTSTRHASAIASRLGIPAGHSTPLIPSLTAPLAARIPQHSALRLPVRVSDGSTRYSRFSEYVADCEPAAYETVAYGQLQARVGGDAAAAAAVEVYDAGKEEEWVLERQVSRGPKGEAGGMVFRDRRGGFHFVRNV
ncbi:hypothetical protein COCSADRAFT_179262 [Bipolaris sorokiniana ND90Pr]|uniref:Uncharacterized protein n=1 Tax=Cochliobolus sativus (strain ND90Pr / ATCC 201652) TaxID=665912 RepID=M2TEJ3_COCSN|nr:uncharacterized protein COCSADRAFT_179262 [Bipolaris sorokiniana ND90Pr]EMD67646.1 hypothetical protein COCSADRAFT_179262 [Bipolaris sorokiniana ND90Pr]